LLKDTSALSYVKKGSRVSDLNVMPPNQVSKINYDDDFETADAHNSLQESQSAVGLEGSQSVPAVSQHRQGAAKNLIPISDDALKIAKKG